MRVLPVPVPLPLPLLLLLGACGTTTPEAAPPAAVAEVQIAPATMALSNETVTVYGAAEVNAGGIHVLATQGEAILVTIVAPNGTAVRAGQIIATLRPSATGFLDAAKAKSEAHAANATLARAIRLRSDGLASDVEVDAARALATAANAMVASVGERNGSLTLRAPVTGTVGAITARPGDLVAAGTAVAIVAAQGDLRVRFGVEPQLAQRVRAGQPLKIEPLSGGTPIDVIVVGVDPQTDATTRLASVYAKLPPAYAAGPGEPFRAVLAVGAAKAGLSIPYTALLDDGGKPYVFVVEKGVAHHRDVVPGSASGDRIAIVSGLAPGLQVVTEGGTALEDGMKVRVASTK